MTIDDLLPKKAPPHMSQEQFDAGMAIIKATADYGGRFGGKELIRLLSICTNAAVEGAIETGEVTVITLSDIVAGEQPPQPKKH